MSDDATIYDEIDFTDCRTDFVYDNPGGSQKQRMARLVCRAIPRGWCSTFGDLALTYNLIVRKRSLDWAEHEGFTFALFVDDYARLQRDATGEWSVPWHRMRDKDGHCRTPLRRPGRDSAVVTDPEDRGNTRAIDEGIKLIDHYPMGRVSPRFMIDLSHAFRKGLVPSLNRLVGQ